MRAGLGFLNAEAHRGAVQAGDLTADILDTLRGAAIKIYHGAARVSPTVNVLVST